MTANRKGHGASLTVERVEVGPADADTRLHVAGLASLVRDLSEGASDATRVAA